jgi:cephalosporin-C deacetylase-like acetyl esterase
MPRKIIHALLFALVARLVGAEPETLAPLKDGRAPQTFEELWAGFDPRREPLDVETLKTWKEDGVTLRVVRYRIGIFKGQKAMMAAVYGFPESPSKLPGLVQIHGGGQYADYRAVLSNAKRGYATISIAWAGRIAAPGYTVNKDGVALFWAGKTSDPGYRLTTDWGALDAYHAPCRNEKNNFQTLAPAGWTLDAVESPRNNPWFLCTLGARRALTFLEAQSEVDPERLGVYGHSMGGKLTVLTTAADSRVKAAAPSCGGVSDRTHVNPLYHATITDDQSLKHIARPIVFLSPANDFHGRIDDLQTALQEVRSPEWRVTCSAHHSHQDTAEFQVVGLLWFDQHLRGDFTLPRTPAASLVLKTADAVPTFTVTPDAARPAATVDIYYTQQGQLAGEKDDRENTQARFWHHARATREGGTWRASLPLATTGKSLWVYATAHYALEKPVTGAGYYYSIYTAKEFALSSRMLVATPDQLAAAGVKATAPASLLIEDFASGWEKEWFTYESTDHWARRTHKIYDDRWQAPSAAKLVLEVRSAQTNKLVVGIDGYAAEIVLTGGATWQHLSLAPSDLRNAAGAALPGWKGIRELRLAAKERLTLRERGEERRKEVGAEWQGPRPEFQNLRWEAGTP